MRVRMLTLAAGPEGTLRDGQVYDLADDQAQDLLAGGYAEPVEGGPEAAAIEAPENTAQSTAAKRRPARKSPARTSAATPVSGSEDPSGEQPAAEQGDGAPTDPPEQSAGE